MSGSPEVWILMYEQMPPLVRWMLTILSGGMFFLLMTIIKRHTQRVAAVELYQRKLATKESVERMRREQAEGTRETHRRLDALLLSQVHVKSSPAPAGEKSEKT